MTLRIPFISRKARKAADPYSLPPMLVYRAPRPSQNEERAIRIDR